ncbi:MAG: hypothetical protein CMK09_05405 [Ponticaulis sp.]|nr:hypothetical protein [Ponticaulis sp.]|tara:strand:- start:321 stop:707 length:387 start_codon:yes stop_codon:yes gene_type:complete
MKPALLSLPFLALVLASCGNSEDPASSATQAAEMPGPDAGMISDGLAIVEEHCTACHAIGLSDDSPRTDAPPLRTVFADLDPEAIAADFREGIHVGANDMPDFDFGPKGTEAVIEYVKSIQTSVPAAE